MSKATVDRELRGGPADGLWRSLDEDVNQVTVIMERSDGTLHVVATSWKDKKAGSEAAMNTRHIDEKKYSVHCYVVCDCKQCNGKCWHMGNVCQGELVGGKAPDQDDHST